MSGTSFSIVVPMGEEIETIWDDGADSVDSPLRGCLAFQDLPTRREGKVRGEG